MVARKRGSRRTHGDRRLRVAPEQPAMPDADPATLQLVSDLRRALRADEPMELLALVSSMQQVLSGGILIEGLATPGLDLFVESLIGVDVAETTAALEVFGEFVPNGELHERIRAAVATRRQPMPIWLRDLRDTRITRAVQLSDVLGDGTDVVLGIRWADGREASYVVYIDHNAGTVVTDAFPTPSPVGETIEQLRVLSDDETAMTFSELDLAEARLLVAEAIDRGEQQGDAYETETWPLGRPLVRWLLGLMSPGAGRGQRGLAAVGAAASADAGDASDKPRTLWDDDGTAAALGEFATVAEAAGVSLASGTLDDACLLAILDFALTQGSADLTQWSPARVEMFFHAWLAGRLADPRVVRRMPAVTRVFVEWALKHRGVPPRLVEETLEAVDECAGEYEALATSPEAQALRRAVEAYEERAGLEGVLGIDTVEDPAANPYDDIESLRASFDADHFGRLAREVGGREALLNLSQDPLPDEPLDWTGLPEDVRGEVAEVARLVDALVDEAARSSDDKLVVLPAAAAFGEEYRTACKRFLEAVAKAEPDLFRRGARAASAAAAVCWTIGKVNGVVAAPGGMPAGELMRRFGLTGSPSTKAQRMVAALGMPFFDAAYPALGRPGLLTSDKRRRLVEERDRVIERTPEVVAGAGSRGQFPR